MHSNAMEGWIGLDPTQKASPIRASSDANNQCSRCNITTFL